MTQKILYFLFIFQLFIRSVNAIELRENNGMLYINNATSQEIEELFKKHKYTRFRLLNNNAIPSIFINHMPSDYCDIKSQTQRNELFVRILAPLAIKINNEILAERRSLLRLEKKYRTNLALSEEEIKKLENFTVKYDYFTRLSGNSRIEAQINNLKKRIAPIPPSIFIAAAAMESNWGVSRLVKEANSLYKEKVWYTKEGLEPLENKDDGYRFKIFDSLIDSMRSFALTFNSNINYEPVWKARFQQLERKDPLYGEMLAYTLATASNLPNFAGIVDYITAFYDFSDLDVAQLQGVKNEP